MQEQFIPGRDANGVQHPQRFSQPQQQHQHQPTSWNSTSSVLSVAAPIGAPAPEIDAVRNAVHHGSGPYMGVAGPMGASDGKSIDWGSSTPARTNSYPAGRGFVDWPGSANAASNTLRGHGEGGSRRPQGFVRGGVRGRQNSGDPRRSSSQGRGSGVWVSGGGDISGTKASPPGARELQPGGTRGGRGRGRGGGRSQDGWSHRAGRGRGPTGNRSTDLAETVNGGWHWRPSTATPSDGDSDERESDTSDDSSNEDGSLEDGEAVEENANARVIQRNRNAQSSSARRRGKRGADEISPLRRSPTKYSATEAGGERSTKARDPRPSRGGQTSHGWEADRGAVDEGPNPSRSPPSGLHQHSPPRHISPPAPVPSLTAPSLASAPYGMAPAPAPVLHTAGAPLMYVPGLSSPVAPTASLAPVQAAAMSVPQPHYGPPAVQPTVPARAPVMVAPPLTPAQAPPALTLAPLPQLMLNTTAAAPPRHVAPSPVQAFPSTPVSPPTLSTTATAASATSLTTAERSPTQEMVASVKLEESAPSPGAVRRSCLRRVSSQGLSAKKNLAVKKTVRVSDDEPSSQPAPIFSDDEDDSAGTETAKVAGDKRGEWPHAFKFLPQIRGRKCIVCSKDFVRICTACGKCIDCFRAGNRNCVEDAKNSEVERPHSPPPAALPELPDAHEWPEYPKTMTRNKDGTGVLQKRMERAIYDAIRTGDTHPIVGLIRAGVSPNFKRPAGETCLHAAAYCGELDLVKDLKRRNADPSVKDSHGNLPVDLAAMQGKDEVVAFLQPLAPSTTSYTIAAHQRHRHKQQQLKQQREKQKQEEQKKQQEHEQQQQKQQEERQRRQKQHQALSSPPPPFYQAPPVGLPPPPPVLPPHIQEQQKMMRRQQQQQQQQQPDREESSRGADPQQQELQQRERPLPLQLLRQPPPLFAPAFPPASSSQDEARSLQEQQQHPHSHDTS